MKITKSASLPKFRTHLQYYVYKSDNKHRLCFMNFHHTEYKDILPHENGGTKSSVGRASQGGRFHPNIYLEGSIKIECNR